MTHTKNKSTKDDKKLHTKSRKNSHTKSDKNPHTKSHKKLDDNQDIDLNVKPYKKPKIYTIPLYASSNDLEDCIHKLENDYKIRCYGYAKVSYNPRQKKWYLCYMQKDKIQKTKIDYSRRGYSLCISPLYTMRCEIEFFV